LRIGGGSTSLISAIDSPGSARRKSRNHMKNQPKLPSSSPASTHVMWKFQNFHGS
jgi:hypothetical protein